MAETKPTDNKITDIHNINTIMDVRIEVTVQLGSSRMTMRDVLEFEPGTVIQLRERATDPVLVLVNDKPVARGEVVVVDEKFGLKITEVLES